MTLSHPSQSFDHHADDVAKRRGPVRDLVIDRSRWIRGDRRAQLLTVDGFMCCLGFLAKACGATDSDIRYQRNPGNTRGVVKWPDGTFEDACVPGLTNPHSATIQVAILANDNSGLSEPVRETRIAEALALLGYAVRFVDSMEVAHA